MGIIDSTRVNVGFLLSGRERQKRTPNDKPEPQRDEQDDNDEEHDPNRDTDSDVRTFDLPGNGGTHDR